MKVIMDIYEMLMRRYYRPGSNAFPPPTRDGLPRYPYPQTVDEFISGYPGYPGASRPDARVFPEPHMRPHKSGFGILNKI